MLPYSWGLLGVALFVAFSHGASINIPAGNGDIEEFDDGQRSKRSYKRGQTQSQYLNFGQPELDGKAEAEATEGGSRSTVSGTHGMGQAQSQFSSGDCSGCGVGGPIYEYSTGSPDPLRLGGNVISYTDGKPSSIIGLQGTSPGGSFGPAGSYPASSPSQTGRPAGGGTFIPGTGVAPGRIGQPGVSGGFTPAGSIGGAAQPGKPRTDGAFSPGATYTPGAGQIGRPGSVSGFSPGQIDTRPATGGYIPGSRFIPGSGFIPGTGGEGQIFKPGSGSGVAPSFPGDARQVGRPGSDGAYTPGTSGVGSTGRPGGDDVITPGGVYTSGTTGVGQTGRPGSSDGYGPGSGHIPGAPATGQIGTPGSGITYGPGSGYTPGIGGQVVRPGTGGAYSPGGRYVPGTDTTSQSGRPGAAGVYGPGTSSGGQTGAQGGSFGPYGMGQVGAPGTSYGYGPAGTSGSIGDQGTQGFVKPGVGATGQQGRGQDQTPHLIAPPMTHPGTIQGPQTVVGYGPEAPTYGRPGQQTSTYTSGTSLDVPVGSKQQGRPYAPETQQSPSYGIGGHRPGVSGQPGQQFTSYGQPGQITSEQKFAQPGSSFGPSTGFAPGSRQQIAGQPQQSIYSPGFTGPIGAGITRPGTHYGPQQILQQPGQGQQGVSVSGQQPGGGFQPGYQVQPGAIYGQPDRGSQTGVGAGYQPGSSFQQPSFGVQQGRVPPTVEYGQPGTIAQEGVVPPSSGIYHPGYEQAGVGFSQPSVGQTGFAPPGGVQQGAQFPATSGHPIYETSKIGSGTQPGTVSGQPIGGTSFGQQDMGAQQGAGTGLGQQGFFTQPGGTLPGAGFIHRGPDYQSGSYLPGGSKPIHQGPTGFQQVPGIVPGYAPQAQLTPSGSFPQGSSGGEQLPSQQGSATQPSYGFGQQLGGQTLPGQQPGSQPGVALSQFPGDGYTRPGASQSSLPGAGVQPGSAVQQGSGFGTGFDASYGQQPGGQQVPNYAQGSQYGSRQPGSVTSQYGQGPQTIMQPGATYIPSGGQTSGVQLPTGVSGGPVSGVVGAEDAFSQAESSIGNGQAAASAQGKKNGGTAKTQVQGTYSSSGSFSASAMTSDNDRSASSQVTGGVEGAMSQSQGQGGAAQSQAQVQVNEKTGGTKASSQSGGIIHQSQSEVQANDKGGLADAQSSGPGQTSSQAQIGFRPGQDGEIVRSAGGGQASAQSGAHSGNSQSQIQGTSKYGVSYHGAAQSASGTKEQVATYREQNRDLFNTISQFGGSDAVTDRVDTVYTPSLTSESDIPDLQLKASRTNKEATNSNKLDDDSILTDEEEEEEPYDEYEDEEDYYNENPVKMESKNTDSKKLKTSPVYRTHTQTSPTQTQQVAVVDPTKKYSVVQNQNGRVQTYSSRTTTETVPNGFRGTVNVEKKFHTKSLEPHKSENKLNITADDLTEHKPRTPDSFVTVTKSITGSMDNSKNPPQDNKNFQSTYYTKSSTCGYFTFSCNIVYGANGRSKICRPKAPTNGKC